MDWSRGFLIGFILWTGFEQKASLGQDSVPRLCVVLGAPGEPLYGNMFQEWGQHWNASSQGIPVQWVGPLNHDQHNQVQQSVIIEGTDHGTSDREMLKSWIDLVELEPDEGTYWLVLMGHGTHDGKSTKFNLRGVDVSALELGQWLNGSKHRWVIAVCGSSSGPFLAALSHPNRVVITSTKSGTESNFSRFGGFFAQSISDPASDLDHDRAISVLEAFVSASRKTQRYYEENNLLATEQAILDDNGDSKGTPADFYRGLRLIKRSENGKADGELARAVWIKEPSQRLGLSSQEKNLIEQLERKLDELREQRSSIDTQRYFAELEEVFLQMARILYPASK